MLALITLAGGACQTAKKPVSLLPPATAPAINSTASNKPSSNQASAPNATARPQAEDNSQTEATELQSSPPPVQPQPAVSDRVAELVAQAESEYQAGGANYQAGKAEAAKENFDRALNALLESNLDIRSDDRLQKEFDRIVEGINKLGLGDGGTDSEAQKSEPAPIDETNGLTPTADPNIKAKVQAELKATHSDLPLMMTDQVAGYISYFSNRGREFSSVPWSAPAVITT